MQAEGRDAGAPAPRPPMGALGGTGSASTLPAWSAPASIYRSSAGFRPSALPQPAESSAAVPAMTVRALLDSATLARPDPNEFTFRPDKVRFTAHYLVRPTAGYAGDNLGRGPVCGTAS